MRTLTLTLAALLAAAAPALAETKAPADAAAPATTDAAAPATPADATAPEALSTATQATTPATTPAADTAAATAEPSGDGIEKVSYACASNEVMQVVFVNTAAGSSYAILLQQDELIPMQIAVSASGARYAALNTAYTYELVTKGDKADLYATTDGKEDHVRSDCTAGN